MDNIITLCLRDIIIDYIITLLFIIYRSNILDPLIHDPSSSVPLTTEHDEQAGDTNDGRQYPQNDPHNGGDAQVQQPTKLVQFVAVVSTIIVLVTYEIHGDTATVSALELIREARTIVIRSDNCL